MATFCSRQHRSIFVEIFLVGSGIFVYFGQWDVSVLVPIENAYVTSY